MGGQVKKHIIALLTLTLVLVCVNCGGREMEADCSTFGPGSTYCRWHIDNRYAELCCPATYPYCGREGTNCPVGKCCNSVPLDLQLRTQ